MNGVCVIYSSLPSFTTPICLRYSGFQVPSLKLAKPSS